MTTRDRFLAALSLASAERLYALPGKSVLVFAVSEVTPDDDHWVVTSPLALQVLDELAAAGAVREDNNALSLPWPELYAALDDPDRSAVLGHLALPPVGDLVPRLRSRATLDDATFEIAIEGWLNAKGRTQAQKLGAFALTDIGPQILPRPTYELTRAIDDFWEVDVRTPDTNRYHWARIRTLAVQAKAGLDQFLAGTIVLTPDKLRIRLRDIEVAGSSVVEVEPWFAGAPDNWLVQFDRAVRVKDRYQIATPTGLTEILVTPAVKSVLSAIKATPGRRMAGIAAERFLHNPFAALGPDAVELIDETQFEDARREAGIDFERFTAKLEMLGSEVRSVGVIIEKLDPRDGEPVLERFQTAADLRAFIARVTSRIETGAQICEWRRHRLELTADTQHELERLKAAHSNWTAPRVTITAIDVHDLSRYSQRVSGIGTQERIVSPYIPRPGADDPWFPEAPLNGGTAAVLTTVPIGGGRDLELVVDRKVYDTIGKAIADAEVQFRDTIDIPGHPNTVPITVAKAIFSDLAPQFKERVVGERIVGNAPKKESASRQELLLRANIAHPEFIEERANELRLGPEAAPRLPRCLQPTVALKEHQLRGVAWLQNLYGKSPDHCRGAVLADDMGLGKTLQLLTLMHRAVEEEPTLDPMLVVAPVSLLENWKQEAAKFFDRTRVRILTLYGSALAKLRAPRQTIDSALIDQGITRFLRPDWLGDAQVVLTTYETLRDLEFSFAAVRWSIMVCDEAQKIKNPAAMVTRSAKKQNARFRIACTGTPVENSLADLWCLFDFVQPGLLGALNEFGATYRRPIECETAEQQSRLEELRALIAPQILRRTKADVAKDLPDKLVAPEPRTLTISDLQRSLYGLALEKFKRRHDGGPFKNHLGLLQHLRRLCIAVDVTSGTIKSEPLAVYRTKNPKLDWLMRALTKIEAAAEKCIIFCELRDIQILLAHYIEQEFGISPDIINGDTEASASATESRSKRIDRFQRQEGFGVIILSPLAAGFGVNIQAANHVVHFSRMWNPAKEDQATDRAYRIGQTKDVHVYYPIVTATEFKTFDVKLDELLALKRQLAGDMLNGCGEASPGEFADIVQADDVFDDRIGIDACADLDPLEFEALIAVLWKKRGFRTVTLTPQTRDSGVDVLAKQNADEGALIQCKSSRTHRATLDWEAVKDVVTGAAHYASEHPGVIFSKVAVTNQFFNDYARHHAGLNNVELVDQTALKLLLEEHRVLRGDLEALLVARR